MKRKTKIIFFSIYIVLLFLLCGVFAVKKGVTKTVLSNNGVSYEQKVDSVAFGYQLRQEFIPQNPGMKVISIYVDTSECAVDSGYLEATVMDEKENCIFTKQISMSELPSYGWYAIELDQVLLEKEKYNLVLESKDCVDFGPKISFYIAQFAAAKEQEDMALTYADMPVDNAALRMRFQYEVPIAWYVYLVYIVFGSVVGFMLFDGGILCRKK